MAPCHYLRSALFSIFLIGGNAQYSVCNGTVSTIADGSCDPWNNVIDCGYDGGDCCECTCSPHLMYPCGFDGFNCLDPSALNVTSECLSTASISKPCSTETNSVQDWVINSTASANAFAEAANCTDGTFNVTWIGKVVIDRTIYVADGTTIHLTGVDSESEVDGGGGSRIFTLVNANLHVSSMVLSNGNATYGGAIAAVGSKLLLDNTAFTGNVASSVAGAVYMENSVFLSWSGETEFTENSAGLQGGALFATSGSDISWQGSTSFFDNAASKFGGAVYIQNSSVSWSGETSFVNNNGGSGGCLYISDTSNVSWSAETSFVGNGGTLGGAIYIRDDSNVSWSAKTSFISNNAALGSGGALYATGGCSVWWNGTSSFIDNTANGSAGGLFIYDDSDLSWSADTSYVNNSGHSGGAVFVGAGSSASWTAKTFFISNNAIAGSGGVFYVDESSVWWDGRTSFTNNTANSNGGALYIYNNSDVSWSAEASYDNNSGNFGGAIYIRAGSDAFWTAQTVFSNNYAATGDGGAVRGYDGCNVWWDGNTSFIDNIAIGSGGAVSISSSCNVSWFAETSFVNNEGDFGGAVDAYESCNVWWDGNTSFIDNTAINGGGAVSIYSSCNVSWFAETSFVNNEGNFGGAVEAFESCNVWWDGNTSFIDNIAINGGGAVSISSSCNVSWFAETSFVNNEGNFGGAVYASDSCNVWWDANTSFIDNIANGSGGAVFIYNSSNLSWLAETSFVNNNATGYGGAVRARDDCNVWWDATTSFIDNTAIDSGGAVSIYISSNVSWSAETSFVDNEGNFGGAVYASDSCNVWWDANTSFIDNIADGSGGAVFIYNSSNLSWLAETSFVNNNATGYGGAVRARDDCNVWWDANTSFIDNTAINGGGAVSIYISSNVSWSAETSFVNNEGEFGGAIYVRAGSRASWTAATSLTNNNAYAGSGGALYIDDGCNVWWGGITSFSDNTANWSGGALFIYEGSSVCWTEQSLFNNNIAENSGGALSIANGSTTLWEAPTMFFNNSALSYWGGAVLLYDNSFVLWEATTSFINNTAGELGGALASLMGSTIAMVGGTFFLDNNAGTDGGAAYIYHNDDSGQSLLIINRTTVFNKNKCGANGGGMALIGSVSTELATINMSFSGNVAGVAGGAVYASGVVFGPKFIGTKFVSNVAEMGGGVYTTGSGIAVVPNILGVPEPQDPFTFISCEFIKNMAVTRGGAFDSGAGIDLIINTLFMGNTAGSGGAARLAGETSLEWCEFVENASDKDKGPAVYNEGFINNMSNCLFIDNVFNCEPKYFFSFNESDVSLDTVCKDCDVECKNCDYMGQTPMCVEEIDHSTSPGGSTTIELLSIEHGYWRVSNTSTKILDCYRSKACKGGVTGGSEYCLEGYHGPYCSVCKDGYTPSLGSSCNKCSDTNGLGVALLAVFGVLAMVACIAFLNYMLSGQERRGNVARISRFIPIQSLKIIVVVWQILTQFCTVANFSFPSIYQEFLDGVDLLNFDFSWVVSTGCIVNIDFHDRLLISTLGPIIGMAVLGATYTVAINRYGGSEVVLHIVRRKHLSMVLLLTFLVYSSVSTTVFTMFVCDHLDDGTSYLRVDYRINCDSFDHNILQIYAGFMVVLYAIGIPAFYAFLLFSNQDTLTKDENREVNGRVRAFADLWSPYKPRYFFYEVVECFRRVLLTGIVVFIYPDTAAQVAVALVLATAFFILFESLAPYESAWDRLVSRTGHAVVVVSLFVALLLKVDVSTEEAKSQEVFETVLISLHATMIVAVIIESGAMIVAWKNDVVKEDPRPRSGRRFGVETITEEIPNCNR